jgi:dihydroorotase
VSEFDLLIGGGSLATSAGLRPLDLGIVQGRVAAWLAPGGEAPARARIDASGLVVLPGLVDAHVHFREPGLTHKEDFSSGTAAAAVGGVTTALVMPTDLPLTLTPEDLRAKRALAEGRLHVDIGLQAAAHGPEHVAALAAAGAISIEIFLGDMPAPLPVADNGALEAILRATAAASILAGITPTDDGVIAAALVREQQPGDALAFCRSRPPLAEAVGAARALAVAAETGAPVHLRQISCRASLELLRAARVRGLDVTGEVTPHNLLLTDAEILRQGPFAKVIPPLRPEAELPALWDALRDPGSGLAMVATDHAPHTEAEKSADIVKAPGGFPGVQTLLPLLLQAVAEGRLDWAGLVRLTAEAPARRFGLYPHKGSLEPGADADLVLVDPKRGWTIRNEDQLSKARITPFAGRRITGWPVAVLLRGREVARDGKLTAATPSGRVLVRHHP